MRRFTMALAAVAVFAASSAEAEQIRSYKVGNWDVGVYTNDNSGRFTHCAAAVKYKSGITLLFSVTDTLEWAIGFSSPDWDLKQGREIDVEFTIDGGRRNTITGRAVTRTLVRATLPDNAALFNQFRYGYRLRASVDGNREVNYNLTSTAAMLTDILNCAKRYKGYVANTRNERNDRNDRNDRSDRNDRNDGNNENRPGVSERDTGQNNNNNNDNSDRPRRNDGSSIGEKPRTEPTVNTERLRN